MGDLSNMRVDQTYEGLIKTEDEQHIESGEKRLTDGIGNNLPLTVGALGMTYYGTQDFTNATVSGIVGEKGDKGDTGATGAAGPQGTKGEKGDTGLTGSAGAKGDKGDQGADSTVPGPQGEKGDIGVTGPQGEKGDKGAIGPSGGEKGEKGDTGADSTVPGPTGPTGAKGEKGDTGLTGPTGPAGTAQPAIIMPYATHAGTASNLVLATATIPAGTFTQSGSILLLTGFLDALYQTTNAYGVRIYIGSSPAYAPAINYAIGKQNIFVPTPNTLRRSQNVRKTLAMIEYFPASSSAFSYQVDDNYVSDRTSPAPSVDIYDTEQQTNTFTGSMDWNVDNYLQVVIDGGGTNDSLVLYGLNLTQMG